MSRELILEMLSDQPQADVGQSLEIGEEAKSVPLSPTALALDDWAMRRGREVLASSELMQKVFGMPAGSDGKPLRGAQRDRFNAVSTQVADFHGAAYEPDPVLAEACENPRLAQYMKNLIATPQFQALHGETQLDDTASEFAAAAFAQEFVKLCQSEQPADDFKADMQSLGAVAQAVTAAQKEVGGLRDAQAALGLESGNLKTMFNRVRGSAMLQRICDLAGKYIRYAMAKQRKKVRHGQDDVVGVTLDGDVGRLLPHELAALLDPDLELDIMRRIVERQAMCREFHGIEPKARGPIVVVVDESGSMTGEPIYTAKAIALALARVARHQRRYCCLVGFSGATEGNFLVIPPGKVNDADLMDWLEHFYSGGTDCDVPLAVLPQRWKALGCPQGKTDVICITDAQVSVPPALGAKFMAWKAAEQVRMISLIINCEPGDLAKVSDQVHKVRSLSLGEEAVADVLGI